MSREFILPLLKKYNGQGAILDTNLFLLLVVGTYNPARIGTFKRTEKYSAKDFALLEALRNQFDHWIATPNIITEVDNLSRQTDKREYDGISTAFNFVVQNFVEVYRPSHLALASKLHSQIGVTDCVIHELATERRLVVTDDFPLAGRLTKLGCDVININNIRQFS